MPFPITIHYDNSSHFARPYLWVTYAGSGLADDLAATGADSYGPIFDVTLNRPEFSFKFKDGPGSAGPWEGPGLDRSFDHYRDSSGVADLHEIWCKGDRAFVYALRPRRPEAESAADFVQSLPVKDGVYIPSTGTLSGLGASPLDDGRVLFGLYHPNAARVFLMGTFNDWQRPGHDQPDPNKFIELQLYRGYFGEPNTWLIAHPAAIGDEYKFCVVGGVPSDDKRRLQLYVTDPYARRLGPDVGFNNAVVVDPGAFHWDDAGWSTPDIADLVLYELSVYGFTEGDGDVPVADRGTFRGVAQRVQADYFDQLGANTLSLMPLAEVPSSQGPRSLGYEPELFFAVERDFGSPDDLRMLINTAHQHGVAVLLDAVFSHTSNTTNLLWNIILEHPDEERRQEGGLYFNGSTQWGNRIDSSKEDVQNMLIDACKMFIREYHVDGFRFDATHHNDNLEFSLLQRLADELKQMKPGVILVAENLPNQADLNRQGFDGYAQWCDTFHDKIKAVLREGPFENQLNTPDVLPDIFFFCKSIFSLHTNNVVNYCENHDETSVPYEIATNCLVPSLNTPDSKDRKGRLGLFATLVALGQPMIYMGQEFNVDRDRGIVSFNWPLPPSSSGFFEWARRLIHLRRRYPGLRLRGYDPASSGQFEWILGPWLPPNLGGGAKVIGWRSRPNGLAYDTLIVVLNFENHDVHVDLQLGIPGVWVKLADIDCVNDIAPEGTNSAADPMAVRTNDGNFGGFTLPSSSGFIYKWESP